MYRSFVERTKDILKVSGAQVSPTEIENALLANPDRLVSDVTVAGVSGGRTSDEKVPRAWVVLSDEGRKRGEQAVVQALHSWIQKSLSKYKWLRGGIEVVDEVSVLSFPFGDRMADLILRPCICPDPEEPDRQGAASGTTGPVRAAIEGSSSQAVIKAAVHCFLTHYDSRDV